MNILVLNSGSSSIKYQLIDTAKKEVLIKGKFEKIGYCDSMYSIKDKITGENVKEEKKEFLTHKLALEFILSKIDLNLIDAIGHRVVHGGEKFCKATVMTKELVSELEKINDLAPLHNPANIKGIKLCMELMPDKKNVAVFDTSFHNTIEKPKYIYPIPYKFYEKYGIRKYGFHGTSVKYVSQVVNGLLNKEDSKIIVCHLGNGASITAVRNNKSVDTSMGFTPLSGIPMGTRCGSIDPSIVKYLFEKGYNTQELFEILNEESGMKGICGISDNREMTEAMQNKDKMAELAFNVYSNRVSTFIGSYFVELEGVDAIVFTGGIGENSKETRKRICSKLKALNIHLDEEKNNSIKEDGLISCEDSSVKLYMIKTDEEMMIAKDTEEILI
ncbi:acetate/propionate family kinase [Oceanivirga miroungae]|uniref:Acetate kinase n=1 Tax=Oceanivirga miroungae TaxID=1130046 RepID=A0A6I8MBF9_9FUSO|nr:acetate kinase [Oceanivirga miroungae]VWL84825.1 acetate kinase [Oceanivirga miroungae]